MYMHVYTKYFQREIWILSDLFVSHWCYAPLTMLLTEADDMTTYASVEEII